MNDNIIVYDLETQKTFAEVGGFDKQTELLVSYLGLYSYAQDKFFGFFEKDLPRIENILLQEQPTIVGFNSISFDNRVVQPYFKKLQINELPQIDILAEIFDTLGFRMKLESVAQATLGTGKSGDGLDAIKYYREGNLAALEKYCMDDVRITRDIFQFGRDHGFILYTSGGDIRQMPVSWVGDETITERVKQAHVNHQQIKIKYLKVDEEKKELIETTVDILSIDDKYIEGVCHSTNSKKKFAIHRIQKLELTDNGYAYQGKLL